VKINDDKLLVIKDYAANFQNLTDYQAETLVNQWAQVDQSGVKLRTKYIPMIHNLLPGKKAARFFQVDRRLGVLLDLQLALGSLSWNPDFGPYQSPKAKGVKVGHVSKWRVAV
jgi:hypothetical protein